MKNRKLIAVWAEPVSGPGWSNRLVRCLYSGMGGMLSLEALQPGEHGYDAAILFDISASVNQAMIAAVENRGLFEHRRKEGQ